MINLDRNATLTKYFVWCCDNLPLTVTSDYSVNKNDGERRSGTYYVENGTTLCHIFWTTLWMPIIVAAFFMFCAILMVFVHIQAYERNKYELGIAAFFLPEIFIVGIAVIVGLVILIVVFSSSRSSGFLKMLWLYVKIIKAEYVRLLSLVRMGY